MGCYGIGVGRALGCVAEEYSDEKGLKLPMSVAPYDVHLVSLVKDNSVCDKLYEVLMENGIDVLYDDRNESAGIKFADAELIGCPVIITVGNRGIKEGKAEVKFRNALDETQSVQFSQLTEYIKTAIKERE